jgi:F-type H+-transporting ATPase subunit b
VNEFLEQFGINWKVFISQLINFSLVLIILRAFVYKPVLKILNERAGKIKEGLKKAEEADIRLKEIDIIGKEKIKSAEIASINIIKSTEEKAKDLDHELRKKLEEKQLQLQKDLQETYQKQQEEMKSLIFKNAFDLVKKTVIKAVELKPDDIDEALIKKAADAIKK